MRDNLQGEREGLKMTARRGGPEEFDVDSVDFVGDGKLIEIRPKHGVETYYAEVFRTPGINAFSVIVRVEVEGFSAVVGLGFATTLDRARDGAVRIAREFEGALMGWASTAEQVRNAFQICGGCGHTAIDHTGMSIHGYDPSRWCECGADGKNVALGSSPENGTICGCTEFKSSGKFVNSVPWIQGL